MASDPIARATRDTVGDALRRAARRFRDRTALRFGPRRWSFAEFTDVYEIQSDFAAKVESEFNKMIELAAV